MNGVKVAFFTDAERLDAARVVEAKVLQLGDELGLSIERCTWDLAAESDYANPHCLDICLGCDLILRFYFTDQELASYWGIQETTLTDNRLRETMECLCDAILATDTSFFEEDLPAAMHARGNDRCSMIRRHARRRMRTR